MQERIGCALPLRLGIEQGGEPVRVEVATIQCGCIQQYVTEELCICIGCEIMFGYITLEKSHSFQNCIGQAAEQSFSSAREGSHACFTEHDVQQCRAVLLDDMPMNPVHYYSAT